MLWKNFLIFILALYILALFCFQCSYSLGARNHRTHSLCRSISGPEHWCHNARRVSTVSGKSIPGDQWYTWKENNNLTIYYSICKPQKYSLLKQAKLALYQLSTTVKNKTKCNTVNFSSNIFIAYSSVGWVFGASWGWLVYAPFPMMSVWVSVWGSFVLENQRWHLAWYWGLCCCCQTGAPWFSSMWFLSPYDISFIVVLLSMWSQSGFQDGKWKLWVTLKSGFNIFLPQYFLGEGKTKDRLDSRGVRGNRLYLTGRAVQSHCKGIWTNGGVFHCGSYLTTYHNPLFNSLLAGFQKCLCPLPYWLTQGVVVTQDKETMVLTNHS